MSRLVDWQKTRRARRVLSFSVIFVAVFLATAVLLAAAVEVRNPELASAGTGGIWGDGSSFHASLSADGRYVTFESWARNWAYDHPSSENWVDIFVHDRQTNTTTKVSYGVGGQLTDHDSLDPVLSADGRYVAYISYATNLVPNDTNGDQWLLEGLDVFVYDMNTGGTQRVSLDYNGNQIDANSAGIITPDGRYILFISNGNHIAPDDVSNPNNKTAMYLRDWHTGSVERITYATDGSSFPNDGIEHFAASYDGRYVVYSSDASNLVGGDTNGQMDIFLYDHMTGVTKRISRSQSGQQGNGRSAQPVITSDGQYVVFRSFADNLVPGDTNGESDVFLYTVATGEIERVSVTSSGGQANGESKDPSVCDNGRYLSYTSYASNIVPGDTNGVWDAFLYDVERGETIVVSKGTGGVWGNARAHRSSLAPGCGFITFASDATNIISGDNNGNRDIFIEEIALPPDFSASRISSKGLADPGETITYTITLRNSGTDDGTAVVTDPIPADTTYVPGSAANGAVYDSGQNQITWNGVIPGAGEQSFSFAVTIDPGLIDFTIIQNDALLSGDGSDRTLTNLIAVNGLHTYLPVVAKN